MTNRLIKRPIAVLATMAVALIVAGCGNSDAPDDVACTPGYEPCLPPAEDYDCWGGSGDGPEYTGEVRVTGEDIYDLDRDGNGIGCEGQLPAGPG